jgi:hypothetical protein
VNFNNQTSNPQGVVRIRICHDSTYNNSDNAAYISAYGDANGAGILSFGTYGSERMTIDSSSGSVGIGGTSTGYRLYVNGQINAAGYYQNGSPHMAMQEEVDRAPKGIDDPGPDHRGLWIDRNGFLRYAL